MKKLDDFFHEKVLRHGKALITNLAVLVKMTSIYESMNEAVINSANRVLRELEELLGSEGEISLRLAGDSFFIEDTRIKATLSDIDNFSSLTKDFDRRGIGSLAFRAPLRPDDLVFLAYSIKESLEASEIQSALEKKVVKSISVGGPVYIRKEEDVDLRDAKKVARRAYTKSVSAFKEINDSMKTGRRLNIKKAKRAVQSIVDCLMKDESYMIGLTSVRNTKDYYYNHSTNVAIFSAAMGVRFGLNKYQLSRLGLAALFHDIGKIEVPQSILNKASEFTKKETELIEMHPIDGVKHLLATWRLNDISIISMLTAFEHHMGLDFSGYPRISGKRKLNLFSRIIEIADDYDSFVSGKIYTRTALTPRDALRGMQGEKDVFYDGILLKAFEDIFSGRAGRPGPENS
ncbi:MAG TPA: HD domain-containing phosphohydrolase [Thermodesulfovibrionales bacterium]|nr:HD domain-containing phosphohydrolase [Thermodesulfovibrionales bacterium]